MPFCSDFVSISCRVRPHADGWYRGRRANTEQPAMIILVAPAGVVAECWVHEARRWWYSSAAASSTDMSTQGAATRWLLLALLGRQPQRAQRQWRSHERRWNQSVPASLSCTRGSGSIGRCARSRLPRRQISAGDCRGGDDNACLKATIRVVSISHSLVFPRSCGRLWPGISRGWTQM